MFMNRVHTIKSILGKNLFFEPISVNRPNVITVRTFIRKSARQPDPLEKISYVKPLLIGGASGALIGLSYAVYQSYKAANAHLVHEQQELYIIKEFPDVKISRKIVNAKDKSELDLVLFQFQTCPYCCKVRAFLDSMGFTYSIVEVDAVLRQDIKWSKYKKVPMVLARCKNGEYVQLTDSSMIISALASYLRDPSLGILDIAKSYPSVSYMNNDGKKTHDILNKYFCMYGEKSPRNLNVENLKLERQWREWTDRHFIHLISPNVYRTMDEALETFEWFSEAGEWDVNFPRWERNLMVYAGAAAMYLIGKRLKKRHNLRDDVRQDIYEACKKWTTELKKRKSKFLGGNEPNLADLAFFGALNSMEGCQAFADILDNTSIEPWFRDMKTHVNANKGAVVHPVT